MADSFAGITETQQHNAELEILLQAVQAVSSSLDLAAVLETITVEMLRAGNVQGCTLSRWDREADAVVTWIECRQDDPVLMDVPGNTYLLPAFPATRAVLENRQPATVYTWDPEADAAEVAHMRHVGTDRLLMLPLAVGDKVIGLVELDDRGVRRPFTPSQIRLCQALAGQAAIAIDHARLYEQAQTEIQERRRVEEQLVASLREKEVLLQEIHHRVKNNLQIVSSLLYLQSQNLTDAHARAIFRDSQSRIRSMALIHEKLYQSRDLDRIDFARYLEDLVAYLSRAYNHGAPIRIHTQVAGAFLGIDSALPCGLIANELVSNALKHAFPDGRPGELCVRFQAEDGGRFVLSVCDDGVGLPEQWSLETANSLGLQLVHSLVGQLEGEIELERKGGTEFRVRFEEP